MYPETNMFIGIRFNAMTLPSPLDPELMNPGFNIRHFHHPLSGNQWQ
jgi:hypothetical protein